jgi:hypothetical protein
LSRWLAQPAGRRSLEDLLACVPLGSRRQTRELVLEWSQQAEAIFREIDLRAFVERALRHAAALPDAWLRELRELAERLRSGFPSTRELLEGAHRVFAVFLLVLLAANLFFPDNLYAKHGGGARGPSSAFAFSDPASGGSPFRFRGYSSGTSYHFRVYDAQGREYPSQPFVFADPARGARPVSALLALTPELRLLDSGAIAYGAPIPGYQFLLEPDRLEVSDSAGRSLLAVHPGPALLEQAAQSLTAQAPLIDKVIVDHRRWLDWTRWAGGLPQGREAVSEMGELERMKAAVASARAVWGASPSRSTFAPEPGWTAIFPGIFLEPPRGGGRDATVIVISSDGTPHHRSLAPPAVLTDEDRFLFWVLYYRLTTFRDARLEWTVNRWQSVHGAALGQRPTAPAPEARR